VKKAQYKKASQQSEMREKARRIHDNVIRSGIYFWISYKNSLSLQKIKS